jgi:serine/threonine protein kinase
MVDEEERLLSSLAEGRYQLSTLLGQGGQGSTFLAVDKKAGRKVAIKRFRVRGAGSWKEVELAEREARVLASIEHPQLPSALDHFEEDGALYLVMDCVDGVDLAQSDRKFGPLDAYGLLHGMSKILTYLHGRIPPLIHRDIKPANIICRSDGSYALVDFGSVRDSLKLAGGSTVVGTFGFMAPEQFQGRALPVSDVYGVGATIVSLLAGKPPEELSHKGLEIDVAASLGRNAEEPMVHALQQMLRSNPDERANSIQEALDTWGSQAPQDRGAEPEKTTIPEPKYSAAGDSRARSEAGRPQATSVSMPSWFLLPLRMVVWSLQISVMMFSVIALPLLALISRRLSRSLRSGLGRLSDSIKQVDRDLAHGRWRIEADGGGAVTGAGSETLGADARRRIEELGLDEGLAEMMHDAVDEVEEIERRLQRKLGHKKAKLRPKRKP